MLGGRVGRMHHRKDICLMSSSPEFSLGDNHDRVGDEKGFDFSGFSDDTLKEIVRESIDYPMSVPPEESVGAVEELKRRGYSITVQN